MPKNFSKIIMSVIIAVLIISALVLPGHFTPEDKVNAQANLLQNPGFDAGWYGQDGVDGQIPEGWNIWGNGVTPASDRNIYGPRVISGEASWIMKGGYVAWTAGGYQQVSGVTPGAVYSFSIKGFLWTCNDLEFSCTGADGRSSDKNFGARAKVGIDPLGGTDPNSGNIIWSSAQEAYDAFYTLTISATAEAGTITVFTYSTVTQPPPALRETYWEDAVLIQTEGGDGTTGSQATTAPPTPVYVPFVSPQSARPDGSVVHQVGEGDTFSSIVVAYRSLGISREDVLAANGWELPPGIIVPGDEIVIMPPGSVNPETGELISGGGGVPSSDGGSDPGTNSDATVTPLAPPGGGGGSDPLPSVTPLAQPGSSDNSTPVASESTPPPDNTGGGDGTGVDVPEQGPSSIINREPDVEKGGSLPGGSPPHFFSARVIYPFQQNNAQTSTVNLCIQLFHDSNYNAQFDSDETPLIGGSVQLLDSEFLIDDPAGLGCITDIPPGEVKLEVISPEGFQPLRSNQRLLTIFPGHDFKIIWPLTEQIPPRIPEANTSTEPITEYDTVIARQSQDKQTVIYRFYEYSGYILPVMGIVAGIIIFMMIRIYR